MKGISLLTLSAFSAAFLSFTPVNKKYIVIDAGHGGNDKGAVHGQFLEKDISLKIAKEIQKINDSQDTYEVVLTRSTDTYPTFTERTEQINKLNPEMVISLHANTSSEEETQSGVEVYAQNSDASKELAGKIYKKFNARKIKEESNYRILRDIKAPAVLVEIGFINNTKDRNYITSEQGQKEIAQKFIEIIKEY